MTSTRDQKDDDVIIVTEDDIVPADEATAGEASAREPGPREAGETATARPGGLADEPGRHRAAGADPAEPDDAMLASDSDEPASNEPDEAPAGDRRAFAMPAAADERMADDRMTGNRMAGPQVPDEQVPGETVPGDETAREEGLAASAARGPAPAAAAASASQPPGEAGGDPWPDIQARFVDDPRAAVEQAAEVTTGALTALTAAARNREQSLRGGWQARDAGTEDLRTALRDYRELAQRLSGLAGQL